MQIRIRNYKKEDEKEIMRIYQKAFAGFPWFENLSDEEVKSRWNKYKAKRGFECLVFQGRNKILGATWWDTPTLEELHFERGDKLADFVQRRRSKFTIRIRETCIDPAAQGRGIGKVLKYRALEEMRHSKLPRIILTRLRDDNPSIIHLNSLLGFKRTGIRMPSSQKQDIFHEYWYLEIGKDNKFVISEDIIILLQGWAEKKGFSVPPKRFFKRLRVEMFDFLDGIFGRNKVDMVPAKELKDGLLEINRDLWGPPAVSMDRVYFLTKPEIQVARIVDENLNDCGIGPRFGFPSIQEQLLGIKKEFKKIMLVDDVLFSGEVMVRIIESLKEIGVVSQAVVAGIAVGDGVKRVIRSTSNQVFCTRYYEEVIDEICERDFYSGVPLSGRLVAGQKIETGAPYLLPFGKPHEWASIPKEREKEFSIFCLKQTIKLWEVIEKASGKIVKCCDLERLPLGISFSEKRFVNELKKILIKLKEEN